MSAADDALIRSALAAYDDSMIDALDPRTPDHAMPAIRRHAIAAVVATVREHDARAGTGPSPCVVTTEIWSWWAGRDDENFHTEYASRDEAIAALEGESGYIVEARKDALSLADYFDAGEFLERADEGASDYSNPDGDPIFELTVGQADGLEAVVRAAICRWQAEKGVAFRPWRFTAQRNDEYIPPRTEVGESDA